MTRRRLALLIAAAVIVLDQVTKVWAVAAFSDEPLALIGERWLRLAVTRNPGASFSLFQSGGVVIGLVAVGVAVVIVLMVDRAAHQGEVVGLGIVLGGAVGNLIDRIMRGDGFLDGAVVDWIDFSFFPAFNVADAAITVGVGVIIVTSFLVRAEDGG